MIKSNNNTNKFEEEVMFMLDTNTRTKASGFISKGAKWVLCDDGACLVHNSSLVLKVTESFYKSHKLQ